MLQSVNDGPLQTPASRLLNTIRLFSACRLPCQKAHVAQTLKDLWNRTILKLGCSENWDEMNGLNEKLLQLKLTRSGETMIIIHS